MTKNIPRGFHEPDRSVKKENFRTRLMNRQMNLERWLLSWKHKLSLKYLFNRKLHFKLGNIIFNLEISIKLENITFRSKNLCFQVKSNLVRSFKFPSWYRCFKLYDKVSKLMCIYNLIIVLPDHFIFPSSCFQVHFIFPTQLLSNWWTTIWTTVFPVMKLFPRLIFFIWKLGHLIHVVKENTNIVPCSMLIFWGVNRTGNEFWTSSPIKTVIFRSFIFDMTETCSSKTQFEFRFASA